MNIITLKKTGAVATLALALSFGLAACGDDSEDATTTPDETTSTDAGAGTDTFGEGCKLIPADGKGSFNGMATDPVATAASNNPLLSTLVAAVGAADLVDTLNEGDGWTVFAPVNDAFADIQDTVDTLLMPENKETLSQVLTHHVVAGQIAPEDLGGELTTVAGDTISVEGSVEDGFVVSGKTVKSNVICGNVQTANATVYIIDTVLAD